MPSADQIMTRLNPLVVAILRSPLHFLLSSGLALITVTGRRSGRRYRIPVGYQRFGSEVSIMVSEAPRKTWWKNYREAGPIELLLKGERLRGQARVVDPASAAFRERCESTFRRVPFLPRVFGVEFDRDAGLGEEQLRTLGRSAVVVNVELTS